MIKNANSFSDRLREARIAKGLNQEQVAIAIGKTTSAYGHYERGRNEMSRDVAQKLASLLDVNLEWLLSGIGEKAAESNEFLTLMAQIDDPEIIAEIKDLALKRILEKK